MMNKWEKWVKLETAEKSDTKCQWVNKGGS